MDSTKLQLVRFLKQTDLERSLLIGYYGGGNYGDELLLEVMQNMLHAQGVKRVAVAYQNPATFASTHHDFGYSVIEARSKIQLIRTALLSRTILVGGGGLWGVDMNVNTFMLSLFLLISSRLLGKKVYLLGVGFYNSTTKLGRAAAWLAGKAADLVVVRDDESLTNFGHVTNRVQLDVDLAWYIKTLDLSAYQPDVHVLDQKLAPTGKTIFMAPRRLQAKKQQAVFSRFNKLLAQSISDNPKVRIILALLESEDKAPELYAWARKLAKQNTQLRLLDFACNPLALYQFFDKHAGQLGVIAPQLHLIITAHLTGAAFMPIVYDNKISELLKRIDVHNDQHLKIETLNSADIQRAVNQFAGGTA